MYLPVADPVLIRGFSALCWLDVVDASGGEVLIKGEGEEGKDIGEDIFKGDVGVPKLDGKDNLDSEETKEFLRDMSSISDSGVQRTVGSEIFRGLLLVELDRSSSGSAMIF